jgi:ferric-dicitrate binding protein FerR (iron transport regulator)
MNEQQKDDPIATLVRAAGKRPQVDANRVARVRAAVQDEWQQTVHQRRRTRWTIAAAAVIAATIAFVILLIPRSTTTPTGQVVETAPGTVKSVNWSGNTLRLDGNTRIVILSAEVARLERGTLYFSSEHTGPAIVIETPFGSVRDIGTQFEVRLSPEHVDVRVREGRVELRGAIAAAGEMLTATSDRVEKHRAPADWAWVERAAPPIRLEGMRLDDVVHRVGRERGLAVEWRAPASYRSIVLHGDEPFTPGEALDAATAAAGVTWRVDAQQLVIEARP